MAPSPGGMAFTRTRDAQRSMFGVARVLQNRVAGMSLTEHVGNQIVLGKMLVCPRMLLAVFELIACEPGSQLCSPHCHRHLARSCKS